MRYVLLSAAMMLLCGTCLAQEPFDQCGIIESEDIAGPCYRIKVIGGDYYELMWSGPLDEYVGDTVRVFGVYTYGMSICMFGICCVYVDSITACEPFAPTIPMTGPLGILMLCLLLTGSSIWFIHRRPETAGARYHE